MMEAVRQADCQMSLARLSLMNESSYGCGRKTLSPMQEYPMARQEKCHHSAVLLTFLLILKCLRCPAS